ncbi:MAG: helix-turn-helix transcriptional regulator [Ferruginibacter sp.]
MSNFATPGEAIRKLRHCKGLMQKAAADKIGVSQQAYSKLERSDNESLGMHLR